MYASPLPVVSNSVCVCVLTCPDKHSSYALAKSALVTLLRPFLAVVVPRLLYTAFTFSQPLLLRRIVGFLGEDDPSTNVRNGLIGATVLIYFGLAVRSCPTGYHPPACPATDMEQGNSRAALGYERQL